MGLLNHQKVGVETLLEEEAEEGAAVEEEGEAYVAFD
jgi:hypothetical protein